MAHESPYTASQVQNVALSLLNMLEDPALDDEVETIRTITRRFVAIVGEASDRDTEERREKRCRHTDERKT
jgi:hypothetical protein